MKFHICETELGWIGVLVSPAGLRAMTLPQKTRDAALREVLALGASEEAPEDQLNGLAERLRRYARGEAITFPDALDFHGVSPFQRAVWEATRAIPRGQTCSYGELAAQVGRPGAARAVGQAMAHNPWPIVVPCHRVVTSDGRLGGYGGGLDMKERLLRLERAQWRQSRSLRKP
jgi:methylated-DNA-[protein]-cysteine S-methyltransferase